jgi:hypothetical protein
MAEGEEMNFNEAQQQLMNKFKKQLSSISEDVLSDFYSNVTPYAETDAHINFKNALRDEIYNDLVKEISSENGMYSWAHTIRMSLLKNHKEELSTKIIEDLQEKISNLEHKLFEIQKRFW